MINRLISTTGLMSFRCPFLCIQVFGSGLKEELDATNTHIDKDICFCFVFSVFVFVFLLFFLSAHIFTRA